MTLRAKVLAGFSACILILVFQAVTTGYFIFQLRDVITELDYSVEADLATGHFLSNIASIQTDLAQLQNSNNIASAFESTDIYMNDIRQSIKEFKEFDVLIGLPDQASTLESGFASVEEEYIALKEISTDSADQEEINDQIIFFDEALAALQEQMAIAKVNYINNLNEVNEKQRDIRNRPIIASTIVCLVAIIILIVYAWYFSNHLTGPILLLAARLRSMAAGNINQEPLEIRGNDELAQLGESMNKMVCNLYSIIRKIALYTKQLTEASHEMFTVAEETRTDADKQRQESLRTLDTTDNMVEDTVRVTELAGQASEAAVNASHETERGINVANESIAAIELLADEVQKSSDAIYELKQDSDEIESVLNVIFDVAEQTNLLALNAAIEAARAGEQGRGFAVVADEVRTLAKKTEESTGQIQAMIERLKKGTEKVVQVMEKGSTQAGVSVESSGKTSGSLDLINTAVTRINEMNEQIHRVTQQQQYAANDIHANVSGVCELMEKTVNATSKSKQASEQVDNLAGELKNIVNKFNI